MKRFSLVGIGFDDCALEEFPDGDFVKFEDVQKLVEALKFYADSENKFTEVYSSDSGYVGFVNVLDFELAEYKDFQGNICKDLHHGLKARQTLKELGVE